MSVLITAETSAHGWAGAMTHLLRCNNGKDFNVLLSISQPCAEVHEVTAVIDQLGRDLGLKSTMENANAIWPVFFARPERDAAAIFSDIKRFAVPAIRAACPTHHDSYIERLIAWRSREEAEPVPQLQRVLDRLKKEVGSRAPKSSAYEISIFSPGLDAGYMSFPCLSHLSLKYDHARAQVHLTAVYRNHTYLSHAYGNYVGLGRLMKFVCEQVGAVPGELLSVSTHADAELGAGSRVRVKKAVDRVTEILARHRGVPAQSNRGVGA